jgi:4-diphosphocytidyl-2-C-methyl-D-erythritol kinase
MTITAPAKINLHLRITGRRPDGFHELESIFVALALGDTLRFETVDRDGALEIAMNGRFPGEKAPPMEQNIVFTAISRFRARSGWNRGIRALVEKRIPLGGGLGGGSSDAAAALAALNSLAAADGRRLESGALAALGASLGSDVPFFLHRNTTAAWVTGRGENIRPLDAPALAALSIVLVNPGFPSGTAGAFQLLDQYREAACPPAAAIGEAAAAESALAGPPEDWPFTNDFLPVFIRAAGPAGTAYTTILARLRETGAAFAGLSGSGSTCFGVFADRERAEKAGKTLSKKWAATFITKPLQSENDRVIINNS